MILRTLIFFVALSLSTAQAEDPIHVISHDKVFVITDPSKGVNYYPAWVTFPSTKTDYRRVVLSITYRCPNPKRCGEWDYIDGVLLTSTKHAVGTIAAKKQIELSRVISPYGWQFDSTWFFTWKADVTDFAMLLHDSCEITFKHTGYESNTDRGWVVTLDFEIIPGRAPMKCLGIDTLWAGSFPYGDTSKPIEKLLMPFAITNPKAKYARVWLMQTGHGMDETENCAEFCRKWRKLTLNDGTRDSLIDQRDIWKECSENPLYPQAGTWPYDRANWCPGDLVTPDIYTIPVKPKKQYTLSMEMQPYVASKPTANWCIEGYVFYYEEPWAKWDVGVQIVDCPSSKKLHPMDSITSSELLLKVSNYGSRTIDRIHVLVRLKQLNANDSKFVWYERRIAWKRDTIRTGTSKILKFDPTLVDIDVDSFEVSVDIGHDDFLADNSALCALENLDILPKTIMVQVRTNSLPKENEFFIDGVRIGEGSHWWSLTVNRLVKDSSYSETVTLFPKDWTLRITDTAGDGLGFWANPDAGYGYVRLLDSHGRLLKAFTPDFGGSLYYSFIVTDDSTKITPPDSTPQVIVFPPRNFGTFDVDLFASWPTDMTIEIVSDSGAVVHSQQYEQVKQLTLPMDITAQKDGVYFVNVKTDRETITRRIRIKRS